MWKECGAHCWVRPRLGAKFHRPAEIRQLPRCIFSCQLAAILPSRTFKLLSSSYLAIAHLVAFFAPAHVYNFPQVATALDRPSQGSTSHHVEPRIRHNQARLRLWVRVASEQGGGNAADMGSFAGAELLDGRHGFLGMLEHCMPNIAISNTNVRTRCSST